MRINIVSLDQGFKILLCFIIVSSLAACASAPSNTSVKADPLQGFNRAVFGFNDGLDRILFKPVSQGYRFVTPDPIETSVKNIFSNVSEVRSVLNSGLQGKGKKALIHTGRFLVNSTLGLAGIFDVAKLMGMEKETGEDFGQTLAVWGVNSGPYLVLPFFGPSTLRDTTGLPVDMFSSPTDYIDHVSTSNSTRAMSLISSRAGFLEVEKLITGDRYIFIRDAYLQRREFVINDGKVVDDFGSDVPLDEDF